MKNIYNKALLYQNFYNAKVSLFAGVIIFSIMLFSEISAYISEVKDRISILQSNKIYFSYSTILISMFIILTIIYVNMKGINKRNSMIFLASGPYKKWDIKKTEIIAISISLLILTLIFLYASICSYINNEIILSMVDNYWEEVILIFIRLLTVGLLFILYVAFMDMLFSNQIVTILIMIITPICFFGDVALIGKLLLENSVINDVCFKIINILNEFINYLFIDTIIYNYDISKNINEFMFNGIIFTIILSIILFFLIKFVNNKITINSINRVFTNRVGEMFFIVFFVFSIIFELTFSFENIYRRINSILLIIILIIIEIFISYKISKIIKKKLDKIL